VTQLEQSGAPTRSSTPAGEVPAVWTQLQSDRSVSAQLIGEGGPL
jgi:hypothetical protein